MKFDATLETRVSTKSGNPYDVVVIKVADGIEKLVFLTPAELALLKMQNDKKSNGLPFGK